MSDNRVRVIMISITLSKMINHPFIRHALMAEFARPFLAKHAFCSLCKHAGRIIVFSILVIASKAHKNPYGLSRDSMNHVNFRVFGKTI